MDKLIQANQDLQIDLQLINFSDIFDISEIQRIQDIFADAHGVASIITDTEGNPITQASNFTDFCQNVIRITEKGCANCFKSDAIIGRYNPEGAVVQPCLSGGLWDAGASITVGGKHIASWLIGQVRNKELNEEQMLHYAEEIGADKIAFKAALQNVPEMSVKQFRKIADLLFVIANELSEKAYNNMLLKQQNIILEESEERFQLLFNKAPLGYQSLDINGNFIDVNQQWLDTLGYERDEVIGNWFGDFLTPMYQEGFRKRFPIFKAQGHIRSEFEMIHKNGSILFIAFDGRIGNDTDGNFMQTHCILQDITESKRTKEALLESEQRFKVLFEDAPDAIILGDLDTEKIVDGNKEALQLFKCEKHQLIGMQHKDMHPRSNDDNKHESFIDHLANSDNADAKSIFESSIIASDGAIIPVDIMSQIVRIGNKDLYLGTLRDITERKKAEVLLENERALYLDLVNTQPAGIYRIRVLPKANWEVDAWTKADTPPYKIELKSDRFCEILEIDPQKFESHPGILVDLVHPDDKEEFVRRNKEANALVSIFSWDCRLVINNNIKWIHFESLPRKLENGDILFTGIIFDITDNKNAAEALRKSEEMMLSSQSVAHICSYSTNLNESDIEKSAWVCSPEFYNIFGMDETYPHTIAGWVGFLHPDHRDEVAAYHESVVENRTFFNHEYKIIRINDGAERWVHGTGELEYDNLGNPVRMYGAIQDITERKKAEEALKLRETYLTAIIENLPGIIWLKDNESHVLLSNTKFAHTFGREKPEDLIGKTDLDFSPKEHAERYLADDRKVISSKKPFHVEELIYDQKGIKWFETFKMPILNEKNEVIGTTGYAQDITERKKAEKALTESEKKLSSLFDGMTEMSVIHELVVDKNNEVINYKIIDCNNAFSITTGISRNDAIGKLATEVYGIKEVPYLKEYSQVCITGKNIEFQTYFQPMDKHFLISVVSLGLNRFATITNDITDIQKVQEVNIEKNKELENYM